VLSYMEIWKPVEVIGYSHLYEVSNLGNVKSLRSGKNLKGIENNDGYLRVNLSNNGKRKPIFIHVLVALSFVENLKPLIYNMVNHLDGNKKNNKWDNLEWTNNSGNVQHAYDSGLNRKGEDSSSSKITYKDVEYIRKVYKPRDKNFGSRALASLYGVHIDTITKIVKNRNWKDDAYSPKYKHKHILSENDKKKIIEIYQPKSNDFGRVSLSKMFGVSVRTIDRVLATRK
jgi:hypothetical protein